MDEPLDLSARRAPRLDEIDLRCTEESEEPQPVFVMPPPSAVVVPVARPVVRPVAVLAAPDHPLRLCSLPEHPHQTPQQQQQQGPPPPYPLHHVQHPLTVLATVAASAEEREKQQLRGQRRAQRRRGHQPRRSSDTTPTSLLRSHSSNSPRLRDLLRKSKLPSDAAAAAEPTASTRRRRRIAQPPARYGDFVSAPDQDLDDDDDSHEDESEEESAAATSPAKKKARTEETPARSTGRTGKKLAVDQMHFRRIKRQTLETTAPVRCRPSFRLPTEQYEQTTDFRYSMGGTWVNGNHCVADDRDMLPAMLTAHTALRPGYKRYMYSDWDATEQDHARHYGHLAPDDPFVRSCTAYDRSRGTCTEQEVLLVYERSRDKVRFSQFPHRVLTYLLEALFAAEVPEHTPRFVSGAQTPEPFVLWQNETHRVKCRVLAAGACVFCVMDLQWRPWLNAWYFDQMLWIKGTAEGSMAVLLGVGWVELVKNLGRLYVLLQDRTTVYQSVALEMPLFLTRLCDQQSQLVSDVCLDLHHTVRFAHGLYERYLGLTSRLFPFLRPHLAAERDYFAARLRRLLPDTHTVATVAAVTAVTHTATTTTIK